LSGLIRTVEPGFLSRVEGLQDKALVLLLCCLLHRIPLAPSRIHDLSELRASVDRDTRTRDPAGRV
jgi:hypothetical protein